MPLGPDRCNGPSGYKDSTIPPPTLKRVEGSILIRHHIVFISSFGTRCYVTYSILSVTLSNKVFTFSLVLLFLVFYSCHFGYYTLVWSMSMDYRYIL
jgi:hypothetical protein